MAKIKLSEGGFTLIPEGVTTFKIVSVEYKEDFGKMKVQLQTKSGSKHTEQFTLLDKNGEVNDGALKAFSYSRHTVFHDKEVVVTRFHRKFVDLETGVIFLGIDDEDAVFPLKSHSYSSSPGTEFVGGIPLHCLCPGKNCRKQQGDS